MDECIFCKIINGKVPSEKVFESENFITIKDINQHPEGHSLVIPKKHFESFINLPENLYQEFVEATKKSIWKLEEEYDFEGFNLALNNGKVAGQIVPHMHLHILPRKRGDNFRFV
ncbi:HIT family protein [Candidatus Pacearchaeota archaeon]|nr:MAG: HIT family protein [Candidatus Pacearchaeota archaeon]